MRSSYFIYETQDERTETAAETAINSAFLRFRLYVRRIILSHSRFLEQ